MPAAVARSRHLSGQKPGQPGDKTLAYPRPRQHIAIRKVVTEKFGGPDAVTPDAILRLPGIKSAKALTEIAVVAADRSAMVPMRPLSAECGKASGIGGNLDGWAAGRYLAAALVAWIEELRASAKRAS